jgi:hypothetical protein
LAGKENKLLAGPAYFLDKIIRSLKMENELGLTFIIHTYKLKTISNLESLKENLLQLITGFYHITKLMIRK